MRFILLTLFTAIVGVLYRRGAGRAFWVGFALFGWGLFLLASDISIEIGSSASIQNGRFWSSETEREKPVSALVRSLVDFLQLNRTSFPRSTGDKVQVLWGNPGTYFPCTVLQINGNQFRIRYDSDPQGTWDEWVGTPRIKSANADRCYRIAELLLTPLFGLAGGMIALWFFATSKSDQSGTNSDQAAAPRLPEWISRIPKCHASPRIAPPELRKGGRANMETPRLGTFIRGFARIGFPCSISRRLRPGISRRCESSPKRCKTLRGYR